MTEQFKLPESEESTTDSQIQKAPPVKIERKITGYSIKAKEEISKMKETVAETGTESTPKLESVTSFEPTLTLSSSWVRPKILPASVYKIEKCPNTPESSVYVCIANAILNEGTEYEIVVPAEIFINSNDVSHQQWVIALTRVLSLVFRTGGSPKNIAEELLQVCDPKGGFLQKGVWKPSLLSQIGGIIKEHCDLIKHRRYSKLYGGSEEVKVKRLSETSEPKETLTPASAPELDSDVISDPVYPENATICPRCNHKAAILMDGCSTCLNCGDSKCG
jgi:hypothetical protein